MFFDNLAHMVPIHAVLVKALVKLDFFKVNQGFRCAFNGEL
jgi:hypothetical protein